MTNPWFGDTAQFLVHPTDEDEDYAELSPWELWQRMSLMDSVFVCGLSSLDPDHVNDVVAAVLPLGVAYEVWSEHELIASGTGEEWS